MFITLLASTRPALLAAVAFDWYRNQYALCSRINDDSELNMIIYSIAHGHFLAVGKLIIDGGGVIGPGVFCDTVALTNRL